MLTKTDSCLNACLNHWGANDVPFSNTANETFFNTPAIQQALEFLQQTAALRSVMVLAGANGVGKSALLAHWVERMDPKIFHPIVITQATLGASGLLCAVVGKLGLTPRHLRHSNLALLETALAQLDRIIPVLVLDEAQAYRPGALDEIRLLLGLNLKKKPAFALILAGDLYFLDALRLQSQRALYSRISVAYTLPAFTREQVADYLAHGLRQIGIDRPCIESAAIDLLATASEGVPRMLNLLARAAWIEASKAKAPSITPEHLQPALRIVPAARDMIAGQT